MEGLGTSKKLKVTPAMVEAGLIASARCKERGADAGKTVREIYTAMCAAKTPPRYTLHDFAAETAGNLRQVASTIDRALARIDEHAALLATQSDGG